MLDGIRCVLFDAVGTLIYPDPPVADVYLAVARRFGSRLSIEDMRERFHVALASNQAQGGPTSEANERQRWRTIVGQVIDDVPAHRDGVFEDLWRHFGQPQHWRLFDDVAPALAHLRQAGYRAGIASNFDARLQAIVQGHRDLVAFEAVFVSSKVGYTKPDARFFEEVERRLQIRPEQIALVGDDVVADFDAATAAGWRAILLDREGKRASARSIRTLAELSC